MPKRVIVIGAGPGGLTAARELCQNRIPCTVLEQDTVVGGLARTVEHKGFRFDIGGHRFFSKLSLINKIWHDTLGPDMLTRPRLSRIYYRSHFYQYPIKPGETLQQLGLWESARSVASFAKAKLFPRANEADLESWLVNRFGQRLYQRFFQTYTEKVWGIPCKEIAAEWAAQRIKGLDLVALARNSLGLHGSNGRPKTLIEEFQYPRLGPGMLWERMRDHTMEAGGLFRNGSRVDRIRWRPGGVVSVEAGGEQYFGSHFVSTMPIRELIRALDPEPPRELADAASFFHYRDFLTVALILKGRNYFPDNWIYVHDPGVKVGRIQNFGNWSPEMVPDPNLSCLGLEYFCFEGDGLWSMPDKELGQLAAKELEQIGLCKAADVMDSVVIRMPKAYPVYNDHYREGLARVKRFLETVPNLQLVGRNGMHRYNNSDHSMLTGILAARNIQGAHYDLWKVNADAEYLEEDSNTSQHEIEEFEMSQPRVPQRRTVAQ